MDRSIGSPSEVEQYLNLPVLSSIPAVSRQSLSIIETDSQTADAYQSLLTNLTFIDPNKPFKTILFTSSQKKEGKTTVLTNLGILLAKTGKKVLLIDADFRNPFLHKSFHADNSSGLTNALIEIFNTTITNGTLEKMSLADIVNLLHIQEKSGTLTLKENEQTCSLFFESGEIVSIQWLSRPTVKRLANVLVKEGKITKEQMDEALQKQEETSKPLGYILTTVLGYVDNDDIDPHIRDHIKENIHRVAEFKNAAYTFTSSGDFNPSLYGLNRLKIDEMINDQLLKNIFLSPYPFIDKQISSYLKKTEIDNLHILCGGYCPPDLSALLGSDRMQLLVKVLEKKFDVVLIDSPPAQTITDSLILSSIADKTIMVINAGRSKRDVIKQTKDRLEKSTGSTIGVVLNRRKIKV